MNKKKFMPVLLCGLLLLVSCGTLKNGTSGKQAETSAQAGSIHSLIASGHSEEAKNMFVSKIDINERDTEGNTPLHIAAKVNNADLAEFFILKGADMEAINTAGDTPLLIAVKNGSNDTAAALARHNADIFAKDTDGNTPIDLAQKKSDQTVKALINEQTVKRQNAEGQNLVHVFASQENESAIHYIIEKMLPLSDKDMKGITPLGVSYTHTQSPVSARIAASLLLAGAEPLRGAFSYFEDAVKTRNPSMRFEDGQTPLHLASVRGQTGIAEYFIQRGASCQAKDASGATPLHDAARYGYSDIVRLLLTAGADPNTRDVTGNTPLLLVIPNAARNEIFDLLLSAGSDPNAKDMYGDTPLHIAGMVGTDTKILAKLVSAGADINERNKKGITPLSLAIERGWTSQISWYIANGADIHAEDIEGNTPLTRSFESGKEILALIITPETVSSRDSFGNTVLHVAVTQKTDPVNIQYLISKQADVNARNRSGDTPLYVAVKDNQRQTGEVLLARNADVFSTNIEDISPLKLALTKGGDTRDWILTSEVIKTTDGIGNTPLHHAAEWCLDASVVYILEKGGNPNAKNANGEIPLFSAVKADSASTIQILLDKGSQKDSRDYLGNTPLHACVRWSAQNAAKTLIKNGANINAQNVSGKTVLSEAARAGKTSIVSMLLDSKADINAADATGKTVLIDAIQGGKTEIVKLLLDRGASPSIQEMYGRNAYHEAAELGSIEMINLIKKAGGNPLSRDSYGRTPLSLVFNKPADVIMSVLGTDINLIDSDGNTPIHIAVTDRASNETLQALLTMGYPVNRRNSAGVTPLLLAVKNNMLDQAKILLAAGSNPYLTDNAGICALSLALNQPDMLSAVVQTAGSTTDIAGEGILHYAARYADTDTIQRLLAMGLDRTHRSISGETPYNIAVRWQRAEIASLLK